MYNTDISANVTEISTKLMLQNIIQKSKNFIFKKIKLVIAR